MPDKPATERTEPPTPERLRKARQEGKVPTSQEMPAALTLATLLVATAFAASMLWRFFSRQAAEAFSLGEGMVPGDVGSFAALLRHKGILALTTMLPFFVATSAAAVFGSVLVSGLSFAPKGMEFKPDRINPASGLKSLVSTKSVMRLVASIVKLSAILAIAVVYLRGKHTEIMRLVWAPPMGALTGMLTIVFGLVLRVTVALVFIALLDLLYQRWQHRKDLRMTRQEVKEERRQHELSPEVRGRIQTVQFEMARKRMLQDVPTADVVVTNPTHVAVALKYDAETMEAPTVVAKGADHLCETIKEVARGHDVPIIQRPHLARTMYRTCEVGGLIPEALYVAVAEILAMIYRLQAEKQT
jgi:flagellar biosynthetic protein FlhB